MYTCTHTCKLCWCLLISPEGTHYDKLVPCVAESTGVSGGPPPIRLVGSNSSNAGRVELLLQGQWGTICDDFWSDTDAQVCALSHSGISLI